MTDPIGGLPPLATTSPVAYANALSPDALMTYLSTRLQGLDEQIQDIFGGQQQADSVRSAINKLRTLLNTLDTSSNKNEGLQGDPQAFYEMVNIIDNEIGPLDPKLAHRLKQDLSQDGYALAGQGVPEGKSYEALEASGHATNGTHSDVTAEYMNEHYDYVAPPGTAPIEYSTLALDNTREYLENTTKELESASQMNMIHLQSLMSSRQTAVSLSTNLIAKLTDSTQKIVENIR